MNEVKVLIICHWYSERQGSLSRCNPWGLKRIRHDLVNEQQQQHWSVSSIAQSCPTLCDLMNLSTPGLPVHHKLPEFTQTHVHRISDAIQPSHPLSSPPPTNLGSQTLGKVDLEDIFSGVVSTELGPSLACYAKATWEGRKPGAHSPTGVSP